ncbi:hypothetical protein [Ichthyenterobacterium magnum]|uniref:NHL repeat-containing protein n=1 Tax=Ichthyenterobacterium magnum TaxID=1230530 RepID=A0A420DVB0_9FLAO|nr:hypothetical protein [Ichthyenterobacterium magnum]RKE98139.1 hypothetical protein BXY80_0213 [Ichthyenterobacterium magnum]
MKLKQKIYFIILIVLSISCSKKDDANNEAVLSNESDILTFQVLNHQEGQATINATNKTISVQVNLGAPINQLVATFSISAGASVTVNGIPQVSSVTANNFTSPVVYTILAEDGVTESSWTVTITERAASTESNINAFEILNYQENQANIDETNKTIVVDVTFGSPINQLIATFLISTGASININGVEQESGVTLNDFTNPVVYKVVAEDGVSETDWTITVNMLSEPYFSVATLVSDYPGNDGISVDSEDNIFVNSNGFVNQWNGTKIYKVTPDGNVSLFKDNLPSWPVGSIFDSNENLYVTGWNAPGIITKISHDGTSSEVFYSGIGEPSGLEIDNDENIYVMEPPTNKMFKIDQTGLKTEFASGGTFNKASGVTFDKINEVFYVTNWNDGVISKVNMNGTIIPFLNLPIGNLGPIIIVDDYLYTTSYNGHAVFRININTLEFDKIGTGAVGNNDGYGEEATFRAPLGVAMSNDKSKIYVSEVAPSGNGRLRVITFNN